MASLPDVKLNITVLDRDHNAEDECVRDLRRALLAEVSSALPGGSSVEAAGRSLSVASRAAPVSEPQMRRDLLFPDIGRLRDLAKPGGFRREHITRVARANVSHARLVLAEVLAPRIALPGLVEDSDSEETSKEQAAHAAKGHRGHGDEVPAEGASRLATIAVLTKCFFGAAFLIIPKGFQEAGIVTGLACLLSVYFAEVVGMLQLIQCRRVMGPGFRVEDLGRVAVGPLFGHFMNGIAMLAQVGFACVWFITLTKSLGMVLPDWTTTQRLWVFLPPFIPLICIRKLKYFAITNILGVLCCAIVAIYLSYFAISTIRQDGLRSVPLMNVANWDGLLWLGTCPYIYEGINFVLPIYESAKHKDEVPAMLLGSTLVITVLFASFGCVFYMAFGEATASMATLNLPQGSNAGAAMSLMFVAVGIVTNPLNFFVIIQTYEPQVSWSSRPLVRKWQKNALRVLLLVSVMMVTWLGGDELQNCLALVGGFNCSFLAFVAPAVLHIAICKCRGARLALNIVIILCGLVTMVLSTSQSLATWK